MAHQPDAVEHTTPPVWSRADTLWLAAVCAVALAARLLYLTCLQASIFFDHLVINAAQYEVWARQGYPAGEPYFQSPLYVTWLRAIFVASSEASWLLVARLWQILLGTASTALAFVAARSLAGRGAGITSGLLAGLAGMSIYFDLEILPTSLATLLLAAAVSLHVAGSVLPERRQWKFLWPIAAMSLGLAVIARPNFLALLPVFLIHLWWSRGRVSGAGRWRSAGVYLVVALLPVLLVTARNSSSGQGFVLLTTSVGDNLLLAHNPHADGLDPFPPPAVSQQLQEYERLGMNMPQRSRAAQQEALQWMRHNPGATLGLWWKKLAVFYNRADIPNNRSIRQQQQQCSVLRLPPVGWIGLALLLPLALAAIVALKKPDLRFLFVALLVVVPVSLMPFLVCARFRTPLIPELAMLAAVGAVSLVTSLRHRRRQRRPLLWMCLAVVGGAIIAWPDWYGVQTLEFPRLATNRARLYRAVAEQERARGNVRQAENWMSEVTATLVEATQKHPDDATSHLWLADLQFEARQLEAAWAGYERAAALDPHLGAAQAGLARVALRQQRIEVAFEHYEKALATRPSDPSLAVEYAEALYRQGRQEKALEVLRNQLQRDDLTPQQRGGLEQLLRRLGAK